MSLLDKFYVWTSSDLNTENLPIRIGQLRTRIENYPQMIVSQVLVGFLLCAMLWDAVGHHLLLGWLCVQWTLHAVEAYHWWHNRHRMQTQEDCKVWRTRLIVFVSCVGLNWAAAVVLMFVPGDLAYQALLICVVLGVGAGAVTLNPVFPPSLYIFLVLLILPAALVNFSVGDSTHTILGVLLLTYLGFVLSAGKELSRTFEQSLRGEWENAKLVGQLVKEKARAEQASQMKSKFFAAANHDLRQPMHALSMYVEVLKHSVLNAQAQNAVEQMGRSIEVMSNMFDVLLDISKLDAGVVQAHPESFELAPLLDGLYAEFSMLAQSKGLHVEIKHCAETVYSDPILLERILRNLLSNAVRYTERGQVSLSCNATDEGLQIEVRDSGIGIESEHLPHIFEEYYQVNNKQRDRSKGLGLGLAIVERLARLLGSDLQVRSTPGEGSCFSFVLPVRGPDVMMSAD